MMFKSKHLSVVFSACYKKSVFRITTNRYILASLNVIFLTRNYNVYFLPFAGALHFLPWKVSIAPKPIVEMGHIHTRDSFTWMPNIHTDLLLTSANIQWRKKKLCLYATACPVNFMWSGRGRWTVLGWIVIALKLTAMSSLLLRKSGTFLHVYNYSCNDMFIGGFTD